MKLRPLSIALLSAAVAVPLAAAPVSADPGPGVRGGSMFKNSATKRFVPRPVAAPRVAAPVAAPAPKPVAKPVVKPVVSEMDAYQARILALTNVERTSRGLRALAVSGCADGYADRWALRLAANGSLSHQSLSTVMNSCGARGAGENVAYGNVSADEMVRMWMNSPGHRKNILNPAYTHLGVGAVKTSSGRVYGVQDFLTA